MRRISWPPPPCPPAHQSTGHYAGARCCARPGARPGQLRCHRCCAPPWQWPALPASTPSRSMFRLPSGPAVGADDADLDGERLVKTGSPARRRSCAAPGLRWCIGSILPPPCNGSTKSSPTWVSVPGLPAAMSRNRWVITPCGRLWWPNLAGDGQLLQGGHQAPVGY